MQHMIKNILNSTKFKQKNPLFQGGGNPHNQHDEEHIAAAAGDRPHGGAVARQGKPPDFEDFGWQGFRGVHSPVVPQHRPSHCWCLFCYCCLISISKD